MKKIIIASNNQNKIREIKQILKEFDFNIVSLKEENIDIDVEEDGKTFIENAYKKAYEIYKMRKDCMVIADDSGLTVDELEGAPGIYSARFTGIHGDDKKNNEKLLSLLEGVPFEKRNAQFVCSIVLIIDEANSIKVEGEISGFITDKEIGTKGFGYDPLFYVPEFKKTFAELTEDEKNSISHRAIALEKLCSEMKKLNWGE
ncbi:putative deoxyribonucleotide triphosphate pyrophosphatase [Clostridium acetobutylicum EA 2018]|uniref:XTP/dITP diphosphatase n=1 Tax=Clostridium acetobutylicum TaxID=1488 RepID=UPI000200C40F|nr:XTP/dITP diphosphatase [Clostridium acetobutylicum]ADZ21711.1 putative deoxyribonucleotide triphosphate pyrophosphatase [Clostridium acetobutylicum EA 2018]